MFCKRDTYKVLGMMSGTSLDGVDLAYCIFRKKPHGGWEYEVTVAETQSLTLDWKRRITEAFSLNGSELVEFHIELGKFFGYLAAEFIERHQLEVDFISSHGQTLFHQPQRGYTFQAGSGAAIAAISHVPVICDFRTKDVALGGQGAPLVPVGDKLLFGQYKACINLGGFVNISRNDVHRRTVAWDICPGNMAFNYLAQQLGLDFDRDGKLASEGEVDFFLLEKLSALDYFREPAPKSLGREWFDHQYQPILDQSTLSVNDKLRTVAEHIAIEIAKSLEGLKANDEVLLTGGGAHNLMLVGRIRDRTSCNIVVPEAWLIDFKEALIFAFLGVLFIEGEPNCLAEVTGTPVDHIGGCMYWG